MFEWSRGSSLRAMMNAKVPEAQGDDWLDGWLFGFVQSQLKCTLPLDMLDVTLGDGPRPYRSHFEARGIKVATLDAGSLANRQLQSLHQPRYDLVTVLDLEREKCLRPLDLDDPLPFLDRLLNAATLLKPGGALIWSYLYCFSSSPEHLHDLLEPASVYQAVVRRRFRPLFGDYAGIDRITIYNSSDTLFVRHRPLLALANRHERVVRIVCGVSRPGPSSRVQYVSPDQLKAEG